MELLNESSAMENLKHKINRIIKKEDAWLFLLAYIIALLVHLFVFTNKLTNHDDVTCIYSGCSFGIILARWFLSTARTLMGPFSSSYLGGLLGSACLAGSAVLILKMLRLRAKISRLLCLVILIAFPTIATTYAYMFVAPPFMLALLLSVVAARLILTRRTPNMILAALLLCLSLGIYQAYFALSCALCIISLVLDLCEGRFDSLKAVVFCALRYLLTLAAAMVLYFIVLKLCLASSGATLLYKAGEISAAELPKRIAQTYLYFAAYYAGHWLTLFPKWFIAVSAVCAAADLWIIIAGVRRQLSLKKPLLAAAILVLTALLPLACNLVIVMSGLETMHHLMIYPLVLPYVLPLYALERIPYCEKMPQLRRRAAMGLLVLVLLAESVCAYMCVYKSNEAYFTLDMLNKNAEAFYNRICTRIELLDGFTSETKVAIIGEYEPEQLIPDTLFTGIGNLRTFLNMYTKDDFCRLYLGAQYSYMTTDEKADLARDMSDVIDAMPAYPADGSIKMIGGVAVVKLG